MSNRNNLFIDLHMHSTASDGTCSPSELVALAQSLNLGAISITDHDTVDGLKELGDASSDSLAILTGIELSAAPPPSFSFPGSFHVLGYGIDIHNKKLDQALDRIKLARLNRNPQIIQKLTDLGCEITMAEVEQEAGGGLVGRPHIAQVMIEKGFVQTFHEAFDKYLAKGKPAFVDKYRISCADAAAVITQAGGIPVLAHPYYLTPKGTSPTNNGALEKLLPHIKEMGFGGMEVYYSEHSKKTTAYYEELAKRFDLLMTGGSDFHGSIKQEIQMGSGKGNLSVPYHLYEKLTEAFR